MDRTEFFKCRSCGANLSYDAQKEGLSCPYCGSGYAVDELKAEMTEDGWSVGHEMLDGESGIRGYHCQNCGAEIVTGETTVATRCYFCHGPVVLLDKIADEYRPDGVIPFSVSREDARASFDAMIRKKWYRNKKYFREAEADDISGVYYPYWYADLKGKGSFDGVGHTEKTRREGDYLITTRKYYRFQQGGSVTFRDVYRKALTAPERQLTDGIHPYNTETVKTFSTDYLSGYLAERRDVDQKDAKEDIVRETTGHTRTLMTRNSGLSGLEGNTTFKPTAVRMRYLLMPTWVLTLRNREGTENYTYMINGQSGKTCGRVPLNKGLLLTVSLLAGLLPAIGLFIGMEGFERFDWSKVAMSLLGVGWIGLVVYFTTAGRYKLSGKTYRFDIDKQSTADYDYREKTFLRKVVTKKYSPQPKSAQNHRGNGRHHPGRRR